MALKVRVRVRVQSEGMGTKECERENVRGQLEGVGQVCGGLGKFYGGR